MIPQMSLLSAPAVLLLSSESVVSGVWWAT